MYDRYIITGATGFLGRAVAEELVRRGAQVYALCWITTLIRLCCPRR